MAKRENGDGSIYFEKARNKYIAAIVTPDGRRLRRRFDDRNDARAWMTEIKAKIGTNEYVPPTDITVGEWIVEWLHTFKQDLRDKSKMQYMNTAQKLQPIANIRLQDISSLTAQRFINSLPPSMAASSRKKVYQLLATTSKKAYRLGMINKDFMEAVEPPTVKQAEIEIFTADEIRKIFYYLKSGVSSQFLKSLYPFFVLAATTGARLGELLALKWHDVDFDNATIHITANLQYIPGKGIVINPPKTAAGLRYVTLPPSAVQTLKILKSRYIDIADSYVFHTKSGTPYESTNIRRYWKRLLAAAGVQYKNFHVLRHTHATQLLAANVPILEVAKRLGHSRASHTLNLYGHAIPNKDRDVAAKVSELYRI